MGKEDGLFDGLDDSMETVSVTDEFGNKLEFYVIDSVKHKDINYLLVVESEFADDDECEAVIIKEVGQEEEESLFAVVDDDEEFNEVVGLFDGLDDYEIEL